MKAIFINKKQKDSDEVQTGDIVATMEEIKEENLETIYANGNYSKGNIEGDTVEVAVSEIDSMIFESFEADKQPIEELKRESSSGSKASREIDNQIITDSNEEANTNEIFLCRVAQKEHNYLYTIGPYHLDNMQASFACWHCHIFIPARVQTFIIQLSSIFGQTIGNLIGFPVAIYSLAIELFHGGENIFNGLPEL
ncbi:hypothetical protein HAX54_050780 [Datura stramonium]|uniref:Uncharacterized protein n=1 Tax=Datura stramonium TaxID=4076 RepID=A0ABS8SWV2_DATST|nr:hypothetical protein [Datura stramonium]